MTGCHLKIREVMYEYLHLFIELNSGNEIIMSGLVYYEQFDITQAQ
jgi:hypothetical protein